MQTEPVNRLATLRFLEGDFEDSARLCLRVLHDKPWHFGASSGIVMVYAQMGNKDDAKRWARHAIPPPGPDRQGWVSRMLTLLDARLAGLQEMSEK